MTWLVLPVHTARIWQLKSTLPTGVHRARISVTAIGNHGYDCAKQEGNAIYKGAENIHRGWKFGGSSYLNGRLVSRNWFSDRQVAENAAQGWMDSPGHRKNIVNPRYTLEGIGVAEDSGGQLFFTQNFC